MTWLVKHASWLIGRYLTHSDGKTSFQRLWGNTYNSPLCEFAESVWYLPNVNVKKKNKTEDNWFKGIWLGKDMTDNDNIIGTPDGIIKCRSVRRLPKSESYDRDLLLKIKATPWATSSEGEFQEEFLLSNPTLITPTTTRAAVTEDRQGQSTSNDTSTGTAGIPNTTSSSTGTSSGSGIKREPDSDPMATATSEPPASKAKMESRSIRLGPALDPTSQPSQSKILRISAVTQDSESDE